MDCLKVGVGSGVLPQAISVRNPQEVLKLPLIMVLLGFFCAGIFFSYFFHLAGNCAW